MCSNLGTGVQKFGNRVFSNMGIGCAEIWVQDVQQLGYRLCGNLGTGVQQFGWSVYSSLVQNVQKFG
jgi:hypothetical protein